MAFDSSQLNLHSNNAEDVATASSFRQFRNNSYHLNLEVDFDKKELKGVTTLELTCLQKSEVVLSLDVHESLTVHSASFHVVGIGSRFVDLPHECRSFAPYGNQLVLTFPTPLHRGDQVEVAIRFTSRSGPGVCWLDPPQTAGKEKPFVYTLGHAVLNRGFFPCFDTPAVKSKYSAMVKVPPGFTAIMSATDWDKDEKENTFFFHMSIPIPAYLIALAVGDIVSAKVGPRSRVWTEPCLIQAAKEEYDGVIEKFLQTGEELFGPYVWERYDVLFMPPSFLFGGMENPCITFVTPCLLAGDCSLADVIIHEISHSWFGNLVTNANWGEFWLNEGFTMYAQRRIFTTLYGEAYTCLEAATGRALLRHQMDMTGEDHPVNRLRVKLEPGVNPADMYNETPYEKGFCFVSYLAHLVGDQKCFDDFLKAYVERFKFQSIMAEDALGFYLDYFPELKERGVDTVPGKEFDTWLNKSGWPLYLPDLSPGDSLMKPADNLAVLWTSEPLNMDVIQPVDITCWKTYQLVYFLDKILEKSPLPQGSIEKLGKLYPKISNSRNAELCLRWCQIIVKNLHVPEFHLVSDFLHSQGKQKYTVPLYQALWRGNDQTRDLARAIFSSTEKQLHSNVQNYVKRIIV